MKTILLISITALFCLIIYSSAEAQGKVNKDSSKSFIRKNFSISGDLGVYGELYSISGRDKRRPSSTGRIYFRPTLHLFNLIDIPFEFLLSTEGSSARQNINQYGINPSWSWGKLHLGDFSQSYSQFTLNSVTIRGAGIEINPGIFRFAVSAGYTQRAVAGGAQNGSFDRFLFASRIGLGKQSGSHFDIILVRAKDDISSSKQNQSSITVISPNGDDALPIGTIETIKWTSYGVSGDVKIELSRDDGTTYETLFADQPNTGVVDWTVTGPQTFEAIIRVTSLSDSNTSDISDYPFTIGAGIQSQTGNRIADTQNPYAITPQENLVLGTAGQLNFIQNMVSFNFEASGSVYTRDLYSPEINLDSLNVPKFVTGIYKPRTSSNFDYAINTSVNLNLSSFNAKIGYKFIGPGYNSLGLAYIQNDQQVLSALTSFRISKYSISLNWARTNDNLINQKLFTTTRNQYGINLNGMITSNWNATLYTNIMDMGNDSNNDSTKVDFSNLVIGMSHNFNISQKKFLRNISFNYVYQTSQNSSYLTTGATSLVHSANVGLSFYLSKSLSANASIGLIHSAFADTIKNTTQSYSIGVQHKAFNNKLNSSITIGTSFLENNRSIRTVLSSGYSFTKSDRAYVSISFNNFNTSENNRSSFNETIASLNFTHRF